MVIQVLQGMYVEHGVTKRADDVAAAIDSGQARYWFAMENGQPVASTGLIAQGDGGYEVGRAASLARAEGIRGVGGLLMLSAAEYLIQNIPGAPLVAEVRVAKKYEGVPSGQATQHICFDYFDLTPHAYLTAFNHGEPNRQEGFVFSSSKKVSESEPMNLPDVNGINKVLGKNLGPLMDKFMPKTKRRFQAVSDTEFSGWQVISGAPFSVIVPERTSGVKLETAITEGERNFAFTLIPISASPDMVGAIANCLNMGMVVCGTDRVLDAQDYPVIWMGKLRDGTRLAPTEVANGLIPGSTKDAIMRIDEQLRRSTYS